MNIVTQHITLGSITMVMALSITQASAHAQSCDKVLEEGARDVIQLELSENSSLTWFNFFCSKAFETYAHSMNSATSVVIPEYGSFGSDKASETAWARRTEECKTSNGSSAGAATKKLLQSFLSVNAPLKWRAWSDCIAATRIPTSVSSRALAKDNLLSVFFRWIPATGATAPTISDVFGLNAECQKSSTLISKPLLVEEMVATCSHLDTTKPAVVHIDTSSGSIVQHFSGNPCNLPSGKLSLEAEVREFVDVETSISTQISTQPAHCRRRCRGWRGYENRIELIGTAGSTLKNCSLQRTGGPNGWFEVMQPPTISQNKCTANVRVWTHSQVWVLSAQEQTHQERWQRKLVQSHPISSCTDVVLSMGSDARNGVVALTKPDGTMVSVPFGQTSQQLVLTNGSTTQATYRYVPIN